MDFDISLHNSYVQHVAVNSGLLRIFEHAIGSPPIYSVQCVIKVCY